MQARNAFLLAIAVTLSVNPGLPAGQEKMAEPWEELVNK